MEKDGAAFVQSFLDEINCLQYLELFLEYGITSEEQFKGLDREILETMGIDKIGDRIRILNHALGSDKHQDSPDATFMNDLKQVMKKIQSTSLHSLDTFSEGSHNGKTDDFITVEKSSVIFILNDGSAKKVNISGCYNTDSIKKRLIKRLPKELLGVSKNDPQQYLPDPKDYDVFVVDYRKSVLHLLYDVELVTICHSSDRLEKNRLIFVSKDQTPSNKAISVSKKLFFKTISTLNRLSPLSADDSQGYGGFNSSRSISKGPPSNLPIENAHNNIRTIFNQRPTSEYISTNLRGYFPQTDLKSLEKTLKEAYRHSVRLSSTRDTIISQDTNNIGDILLKHSNAVDHALLASLDHSNDHHKVIERNNIDRIPPRSVSRANSNDIIKLLPTSHDDEDLVGDSDLVSLPTKISAPKAWLKGARIGAGSFGSVYLGMNATTGELMAVKQVALKPELLNDENQKVSKDSSNLHKKMVDALQHEMSLLKELHHENIVTYYGSSQEKGNLNIFLEYVPGGSVSSMLNNYGPFEESLIINFTRQILIGLSYLHKKNIIHRDIKGANILIDIKGCVKITDFGISKKLSPLNNPKEKRASLQGSIFWMAPEVVKQTATTDKVDIWSTGCVVVEMFTGNHPFPDFSQMQALFKIGTDVTPEIPSWAQGQSEDFLMKTFDLDYKSRPSAIELLQHPWLDTHII